MLEWLWFVGLMVVSLVCAIVAEAHDHDGEGVDAGSWQLGSHCAAFMAIAISWERAGAPVLAALRAGLPQAGSQIADFTAYVLIGLAGLVIVGGVPFATMMLRFGMRSRAQQKPSEKGGDVSNAKIKSASLKAPTLAGVPEGRYGQRRAREKRQPIEHA